MTAAHIKKMKPITFLLPKKPTLLIAIDESYKARWREQRAENSDVWAEGVHFNFMQWVPVTHETTIKVKPKIPKADLNALGCRNPDIWVVSKTDDTIVLTPSKSAIKSKQYRKTKHVTEMSAKEILGEDWLSKINPLKLHTHWDALFHVVAPNLELWEQINWDLNSHRLMGVIYNPAPRSLTLMLRSPSRWYR
ncbi:hypothetical protein [Herbaspirillum seropedicae]|uniref:hypothetical protein n=1 Tax=Herbaspirillum seropedicae TaxID=964 RepID=UPI002863B318|nr:hypothetical protein [Herbaspirillum seropedicae]MDR6398521.1 hypothetical protein [Herbaspirillum seropedicae]